MTTPETDREAGAGTIRISLDVLELKTLSSITDYYQKSMGPMRILVRFTSGPEMRRRFQFVAEESRWLRRAMEAEEAKFSDMDGGEKAIDLTPRAAVALWGRLLSSLHSARSRRKLSVAEINRREVLAVKIQAALAAFGADRHDRLLYEIGTRREPEQGWMRELLSE